MNGKVRFHFAFSNLAQNAQDRACVESVEVMFDSWEIHQRLTLCVNSLAIVLYNSVNVVLVSDTVEIDASHLELSCRKL